MKKSILKVAIVALAAMVMPQAANAQSILKSLKSAASSVLSSTTSSNSTTSALSSVLTNLLGTETISSESLVGTWSYSQPCVAFESENVLTNLGGSAVSSKIESTLSKQLTRIGFTSGKVVLTLKSDSTGTVAYNGKSADITWTISDSNLSLTFPLTSKTVKMNTKMSGSELQVAMSATKLMTLISAITNKASTVSSSLSTVSSLMKNVKGMYVGLKFAKKGE